MSMKLKTASGSITLTAEDGSGDVTIALPRAGFASSTAYALPDASATVLGGVKVGTNLSIASGVLSATDTNTTYSVGDGGLTTNDFTTADHDKLDAIAAGATANVGDITGVTAGTGMSGGGTSGSVTLTNSAPNIVHPLVETAVPSGAVFTDTTYVSSDFTHDSLTGFVANEHIDWSLTNSSNIHSSNYTDTNTVYLHPTDDGNLHVPATSTTNNGKVLTAGSTAGALTWETPAAGGSGGTLTTKGDLESFTTVQARLPVGTNAQVLTADSTVAAGVKWATPAAGGGIGEFIDTSIAISHNDTALANDDGTANNNIAIGINSSNILTTGIYNTTVGYDSGKGLTNSHGNAYFGWEAGLSNSTGTYNTAMGTSPLRNFISGTHNVGIGYYGLSGAVSATGSYNVGVGYQTGHGITTGQYNVLSGYQAGYALSTGGTNVMIGDKAGYNQTTSGYTVLIGPDAGRTSNGNSNFSVAIGREAGKNSLGTGCVFIGHQAGYSGGDNKLAIGNGVSNQLITGDFSTDDVTINGRLNVATATVTTTATTAVNLLMFKIASANGAKVLVQVKDSVTNAVQISELLVTHDGSTIVSTQYGDVFTAAQLATFDVNIATTDANLSITTASANSTVYTISVNTL